jgi:hypothetical protein
MADNEEGFSVQGESLARIGRVVREVETNSGIGPPEQRRKRGRRSILEGVFTEDLAACADPNVPTTAKFQIKTLVKADNSWANEDSPSIVPVLNRTSSSWSEGDVATIDELYLDKYFVRGNIERLQAVLMEDLYAAVNTKRDPSTAICRILRRKSNGDLKLTTEEKTVVNRFKNISIDSGTYIKIEWIDGEWQPYAADCPGGSSSSGSGSV